MFLAEGFEEIEALATVDVLRRGGIDVKTVSIVKDRVVTGAHGIPVTADLNRKEFNRLVAQETGPEDVMIFPGGMPGTRNLALDIDLMEVMVSHHEAGGTIAAICAAPGLVVSQLPTLEGKKFTCYTGFEDAPKSKGGIHTGEPAVTDGNLITGRGPGCAVRFALEIVEKLKGAEVADQVRDGMLV